MVKLSGVRGLSTVSTSSGSGMSSSKSMFTSMASVSGWNPLFGAPKAPALGGRVLGANGTISGVLSVLWAKKESNLCFT